MQEKKREECAIKERKKKKKKTEREGKSEAKRGVVMWGLGSFSQVWSWQQQEKRDFVCLQEITFLCFTTYASKYVSSKFNTKYINKLIIIMIPELIVPNSNFRFPIGNLSDLTYSLHQPSSLFLKLKQRFLTVKEKRILLCRDFFSKNVHT